MFKVLGVDHIGIAVGDLKEVGSFWGDMLGLPNSVELDADEVYRAMTHDKKGEGDSVTVTTVSSAGVENLTFATAPASTGSVLA